MYHQHRPDVKGNVHRLSTRPDSIFIHVGRNLFEEEAFYDWYRVLELGVYHRIHRQRRSLVAIYSPDSQTEGWA